MARVPERLEKRRKARRRTPWRRLRRATRGPRNALLARAILAVGRALGLLPVPAALALGEAFGATAYALLGTPRRFALEHLGIAFPELDAGARARHRARRPSATPARSFAELALLPKLSRRPGLRPLRGPGGVRRGAGRGRGAIAVTGHVGNWELLAARSCRDGFPHHRRRAAGERRALQRAHRRASASGRAGGARAATTRASSRRARRARRGRVVALLIDQDTRRRGGLRPVLRPPGADASRRRRCWRCAAARRCSTVSSAAAPTADTTSPSSACRPARRGRDSIVALTARLTAAIEAHIRHRARGVGLVARRWRRQDAAPAPAARASATSA